MSKPDNEFCDECDVHRSLHFDPADPTPADCELAGEKADLIARFPFAVLDD